MSLGFPVRVNGQWRIPNALRLLLQSLGTTTTAGLSLENTTPAADGAQQYSPGQSFIGQGWKTDATAASMPVETRWELRPVQGAAAPTFNYVLMGRINGGAWTDLLLVGSTAFVSVGSSLGWGFNGLPGSSGGLQASGSTTQIVAGAANGIIQAKGSGGVVYFQITAGVFAYGSPGDVTTSYRFQKKVTAIADAAATTVFTVTVPNANHAAAIRLMFLSSNGGADAFESSRAASGMVVLARTTGVATVATAATIDDAAIATVAAGSTHTLAYSVTGMTGAVGATQTFDIQVTIDDSGNLGSNQVVAIAELLNAEATGVTIA